MNHIFELITGIFENLKKHIGGVGIFFLGLFIQNSISSWFHLKGGIRFFSTCLRILRTVGKQIVSVAKLMFVFIRFAYKSSGNRFQLAFLTFFVLFSLIQLKLHQAGIIKLSPEKAFALLGIALLIGISSVISKMDFSKMEMVPLSDESANSHEIDSF